MIFKDVRILVRLLRTSAAITVTACSAAGHRVFRGFDSYSFFSFNGPKSMKKKSCSEAVALLLLLQHHSRTPCDFTVASHHFYGESVSEDEMLHPCTL